SETWARPAEEPRHKGRGRPRGGGKEGGGAPPPPPPPRRGRRGAPGPPPPPPPPHFASVQGKLPRLSSACAGPGRRTAPERLERTSWGRSLMGRPSGRLPGRSGPGQCGSAHPPGQNEFA